MISESTNTPKHGAPAHGGELVDRRVTGDRAAALAAEAVGLPAIELSPRLLSDLEMLCIGAYSPLTGFMTQIDYQSVVDSMHLANGLPWTIPIVLSVDEVQAKDIQVGEAAALVYEGERLAVLRVTDKFPRDLRHEVTEVYRTDDENHPGVAAVLAEGQIALGGPVDVFGELPDKSFPKYRLPPAETRRRFADNGWKTIVGFQTRNPVHRAHEYLQKCAMEIVDGLLLHPLVGATKSDDVPATIRMQSYEVLLEKYYPHDRVMLCVNPASMRYGGPREAVFHALIRKNFGCTHFIVGRDHAGVGNYYGPYDAQFIFGEFDFGLLGIQPLFFENSFFCRICGNMATEKTCPHDSGARVSLSGTQVREMLRAGELPPPEFSRPEVAAVLAQAMKQ